MDLSVFLILLFVALNFVAECFNWNQYRVKLGIFIATVVVTLPNIIFMVIDWWQSPHSKMALLVLNTFKPILRGETYRLFRWLKLSVGVSLTSDDINYLPISIPTNTSDFFVTKNCFQALREANFKVIPEEIEELEWYMCNMTFNTCTCFVYKYENRTFLVHQLKVSRKLRFLWGKSSYAAFLSHPLYNSSLIRRESFSNVDTPTAKRLALRLRKVCNNDIPILVNFEYRREWNYFHAADSTLEYLNEDLVLIQGKGESIAVR